MFCQVCQDGHSDFRKKSHCRLNERMFPKLFIYKLKHIFAPIKIFDYGWLFSAHSPPFQQPLIQHDMERCIRQTIDCCVVIRSNCSSGCVAHWLTETIIWILCMWFALAGCGDAGSPQSALRDREDVSFFPLPSHNVDFRLYGEGPAPQAQEAGVGVKAPWTIPYGPQEMFCVVSSPDLWLGAVEDAFPAELFVLEGLCKFSNLTLWTKSFLSLGRAFVLKHS